MQNPLDNLLLASQTHTSQQFLLVERQFAGRAAPGTEFIENYLSDTFYVEC